MFLQTLLYTGCPKFYGLPTITNQGPPWGPQFQAGALSSMVLLKSWPGSWNLLWICHHIMSLTPGAQQNECIISYDVKALFTSVPIHPTINIIKNKLSKDKDLQQRTSMAIHHIISLLGVLPEEHIFCIPRLTLWTTRGCSNGISNKPHSGWLIYGGIWS